MGTFERLRKTSPYLLAAFAIIFVGFMVLSDANISDVLSKRGKKDMNTAVLATINGEDILYKDYQERVQKRMEMERQQNNGAPVEESYIRQEIWEQMVNEVLLRQEAKKAGIVVTNEEILDIMIDNPPAMLRQYFTDSNKVFQKEQYLKLITDPDVIYTMLPQNMSKQEKDQQVKQWKDQLIAIEKEIRANKLYVNFVAVVNTAGSILSSEYARNIYTNDKQNAGVQYAFFDARAISDSAVSVSDSEIKEYYDKNKQYYKQKPMRKLRYAIFPLVPSAKDTANAQKYLDKFQSEMAKAGEDKVQRDTVFTRFYKETEYEKERYDSVAISKIDQAKAPYMLSAGIKDIVGPIASAKGIAFVRVDGRDTKRIDSAKASHILIPFGANKDSAKALAEDVLKQAKSGKDFADLARQYSQDPGSKDKGGDLGYFTKGSMVKQFEDAVFDASSGSIVGPVETKYGYHIINVVEKKATDVDRISYTEILIAPKFPTTTKSEIKREANTLSRSLNDGQRMEDVLSKLNPNIRMDSVAYERNKPVARLNSPYISSICNHNKAGFATEPVEIKRIGIVVAQVSEVREAGTIPMEDMKPTITRKLMNRKKLDLLKTKAEAFYSQVQSMTDLNQAASIDPTVQIKIDSAIRNNGYIPSVGTDNVFTQKVMMLPIGKISEPIRGEMGYYIAQVLNRNEVSEEQMKADLPKMMANAFRVEGDKLNPQWANEQYPWYQKMSASPWFQTLRENAKIEDNRYEFFKDESN